MGFPFIIAEIGVNFRNLNEADEMIREAKEAGADAVKFQAYERFNSSGHPLATQLNAIRLDESSIRYLYWRCYNHRIDLIITPMYSEAVDMCAPYVRYFKVRYADQHNLELLSEIAETGKPVLISTDIEIKTKHNHPDVYYLYCVSEYPPKTDWNISNKGKNYDGFSSHYPCLIVNWLMCVNNGYDFLEVHVKRDHYPDNYCPIDNNVSITMSELKKLCEMLKRNKCKPI